MKPHGPVLQYERPVEGSCELSFAQTADGFTLVFPLPPRWLLWCTPSLCAVVAVLVTYTFSRLGRAVYNVGIGGRGGCPPWLLVAIGGGICLWWAMAIYQFVLMRTWGRVPTQLVMAGTRLMLAEQSFWGIRRRQWLLEQVRGATVQPVRAMLTSQTIADLCVRFHEGNAIRLRLKSKDADLPNRVAELIRLGVPRETHAEADPG